MINKVLIEFRLDEKPVVGFIYERGTLNAIVIMCYMIKLIEDKLYRPDLINEVIEKFYTKGNVEVSIVNNIINYTLSSEDLYINKALAFRDGNYDTIPDNIQKLICHIDTEVIITENIIMEIDSDDLKLKTIDICEEIKEPMLNIHSLDEASPTGLIITSFDVNKIGELYELVSYIVNKEYDKYMRHLTYIKPDMEE